MKNKMNYETWAWKLNYFKPIDKSENNMTTETKPILFIMAKTYGAAREFMAEHQIEKQLGYNYSDFQYLHRKEQLAGLVEYKFQIVFMPRYKEMKCIEELENEIARRNLPVKPASLFLYQTKLVR